jgi:hypothetical protein
MESSPALSLLIDAVDRPARAAVDLGRRGVLPTVGEACVGVAGVAAASVATQLLLGGDLSSRVDGLMAFLEVTLLLVPIVLVAAFARIAVPLRAMFGAVAVGLLHAGVVALTLLPLAAFVAVVADLEVVSIAFPVAHDALVGLVVPFVALLTLLERATDIVRSIDGDPWVARLARLVSFALAFAFLARAWQLI